MLSFKAFILGILALSGWGILTYVVWDSIPKGGYYVATNLFLEMWIEAIIFPIFVIASIIIMILEARSNGYT